MSRDWSRRSAFGAKADRDRKLELALKHELRSTGTPAAEPAHRSFSEGGCVDAETLAAWADGGLEAVQMAAVELHVSTCARCQAIVGAAARSAPAIAPMVGERAFWFPKWAIAPLAAAAAVTIWMIVPHEPMQAPPTPSQAVAPREDAAPNKAAELAARDSTNKQQVNEIGAIEPAAAPPPAEKSAEGKRERSTDAPPAFQDRQQRAQERAEANLGAVAAAPPVAPGAPAADTMLQRNARLAVAPLEIVSPDPSSRWRITNRSIERSEDGGASWVPIRAPGGESFTGGVSPARSVCWLIGSSGLVMVTADGLAFARVPLPEPVDLTAITATDARSATVTTADGRRFRTDDSGRTWRAI